MHEFAGRRVTVMGLGRFGGGAGVTRWLASQGADVLVTDLEPEERLSEALAALGDLIDAGTVTLRLGGHNVSDFTTCDVVVANPAVPRPWENRYLRAAQAAGIPVTTEIGLVIERARRERVVGVTGSAGKSTTAAMIAHALRECGQPVALGGNIGGSLLGDVEALDGGVWVVLELSSAMLHWIDQWSPHIAVVTGFAANHLDWHRDVKHYEESKQRILQWQQAGDVAVLAEEVAAWPVATGVRRIVVPKGARCGGLLVPGHHNEVNAALAIAACRALGAPGVDEDAWADALGRFGGLPHRLEFVGEVGGARFYNDSKSTTPQATLAGVEAFAPARVAGTGGAVHLIAGGYDKGGDLGLIAALAPKLGGLYTIGATGKRLAATAPGSASECGTLERAVELAFSRVRAGDIVLLSPGCASWDQFPHYEARGERFRALVRERMRDAGSHEHASTAMREDV
jgi:UDP-N-acetylmuramoylalanine--D-glutamate ligase